jgi:hypothetical protein
MHKSPIIDSAFSQTPYEEERDRRKKWLHNNIELAFRAFGVILDD